MTIQGTVINGAIVLDRAELLPEGARVEVIFDEKAASQAADKPTLAFLLKYAGCMKDLPADFAAQLDQAAKISIDIDPPFALDIIIRTPHNMQWRLAEGESFLREITSKGKILYEKDHARMGAQSGKRLQTRRQDRTLISANRASPQMPGTQ